MQPRPRGGLQIARTFSPALGLRKRVGLYVPPGLTSETPVVYLFRGHHEEWLHPRQDPSRRDPLPRLVARDVAAGRLPPVVLVMPCLASEDRRAFATAVDWRAPHLAAPVPGLGLGAFESYLTRLIPRLEEALGLETRLRVALGFSLGGLTALQLTLRHPGLFRVAAAYDGSFFRESGPDSILEHPWFAPAFGAPRDRRYVDEHSPVSLAARASRDTEFHLQSGPEAAEPHDSNFFRTQELIRALEAHGHANRCEAVDPAGRHDWATADRFAHATLRRILV